mgnify:CR=1 FL=1|tara:strand:- start:285 stop:386 length:102 start_codon:yes stop_codon:yes gene_type:complete
MKNKKNKTKKKVKTRNPFTFIIDWIYGKENQNE